MFRFPARSVSRAFLFLFLIASTAPSFAQGAKTKTAPAENHLTATLKSKHRSASKKSAAKPKHAMSPEQRERIAEEMQESKRAHDKPMEAEKFEIRRRIAKGEKHLPIEKLLKARDQMKHMKRFDSGLGRHLSAEEQASNLQTTQAVIDASIPTNTANLLTSWQFLGPGNIGGRTRAIVVDPVTPTTIYAAAVAGGVWKTTNGGTSWFPLDDLMANIAVNSLVMDPNDHNTLYAGTGEGFFNLDAIRGNGIFKTIDGGANWTQLANTAFPSPGNGFSRVNKIVVSKGNSQHIYAATRQGIYRSTDGGTNWTQVLNASNAVGCADLAIRTDITATDWVIASCGMLSAPQPVGTGIPATVYVNQDAGGAGSWVSKLTEAGMSRTSLAIAPAIQTVVYALSEDETNPNDAVNFEGFHAVFRSADGGLTWTAVDRNNNPTLLNRLLLTNPVAAQLSECGFGSPGSDSFSNQGWYDNVIAVDPADVTGNKVFVGGIDLFRSDNGGASWGIASYWWFNTTDPQYTHADHHAIAFDPGYNGTSNQIMYVADDGGIQKTTNARAATSTDICGQSVGSISWTNLNNTYGVTQFYDGSPFPNGTSYIGGAQDNGTNKGSDGGGPNFWVEYDGGDGGYTAVDPTNTQILYSEYVNGDFHKSTTGGNDPNGPASMNSGISDVGFEFIPPFVLDPVNHNILWTGGYKIWRTSNGMTNWTRAASLNFDPTPPLTGSGDQFTAFAVDPTNDNIVYAGTANGAILKTTVGTTATSSTAWTSVTASAGNFISWIAVDPTVHTTVFATVSTYSNGSAISHVLRSTNSGASWSAIDNSGNAATSIPDIPAHTVLIDPINHNIVYVGTDLGIFVTQNASATPVLWSVENTNFTNAPVYSLKTANNNLFAFTHGRSAWRVPLATSNPPDFSITTSGWPLDLFPGDTGTIGGNVVPANGYTGSVTLSCISAAPSTCTFTPNPADTSSGTVPFINTVSNPTTGDFIYHVHGTDGTISHDAGVKLHVVDFSLSALSNSSGSLNRGAARNENFLVQSGYTGNLTLSCGSLPANTTCAFSGTGVTTNVLAATADVGVTVTVTISTTSGASAGTYPITFNADGTLSSARNKNVAYSLTINSALANADLSVGTITQAPLNTVAANATVTYTIPVTNNGPDTANNVKLASVVPAGYTFVAAGSGPNCSLVAGTVTCNAAAPLLNGGLTNFTIKATANAAGSTLNTFTASADEADNTPGNNSNSVNTIVPDFTNAATNSPLTVFAGAPLNLTGTLTSLNGYASAVTLTCTAGGTAAPSTCTKTPVGTVTPSGVGAAYNMSVTNTAAGNFNFNVHAVGADAAHATHDAAVTVNVVDFTVGNVTPALGNVNKGASLTATFDVTSLNSFAGNVTLSCGSLPLNTTCTFAGAGVSGNVLTIAANAVVTVAATITTTATATAATTNITFKAAATVPSALTKTSTNYALTINNVVANADLSVVGNQSPANAVTSGDVTYNLTVASAGPNPATNATVTSNTPAGYAFVSATPSAGTCNAAFPISCNLGTMNNADSQTIAVVLTPVASGAGTTVTFTVASGTADNTAANNAKSFTTTTPDYSLAPSNSPVIAFPSGSISLQGNATAANGYASLVTLSCTGGIACSGTVTPTNNFSAAATAPASTGNNAIVLHGVGADAYAAAHTANFSVNVVDFNVGVLVATSASVNLGASTSTTFTVQSVNNYAGTLTLSCPGLPANGVTCSFSGAGVAGTTLTLAAGANPTVTVNFVSTTGVGASTANPTLVQVDASTPSARSKNAGTFTVNLTVANAQADLSVGAVTQSPLNPVTSANTLTYTFTVSNAGPDVAHNAIVTYNVPAGYTFVAAGSGPNCAGTTTVICNAGTINSGGSAPFTIKATPGLVASQLMTFTATADEPDPNGGNNSGTTTTNVKDFTVTLATSAITIPQPPAGLSSSVTVPVTITGLNGFITSTALACTGQPAGMTCAFAPASVIPNGVGVNSNLTITSSSTVPVSVFSLQVKGTSGTLVHQKPLSVTTGGHNFTQAIAPLTQNVTAGSSAAYTVTYTPLGGMTEDIAVGCGALPLGVTCTPVPAIVTPNVTPGNQSIVTLQTTFGTTPSANATVAISGVSAALNNLTRSSNVTLSVKDFTVTRNTATVATNVGSNITDTILVKGLNGFTGVVALTCAIEGTPAGTACNLSNLNPAASAAGTSVTATITSNAGTTPQGTYTVDITGTNSGQQKTASFTVQIKDFTLGLGTNAITIPQPPPGQSSSVTVPITLTAENGFNSSTTLSCVGQPAGVTCAFSPASGIPTIGGLHSTLTITGASTAAGGPHDITVKGTAGTLIRTQVITVTLWGPNFTQAVTPTTQNVTAGSSAAYTVVYTPFDGMNQDITVGCGTLPLGVTCSPVPPVVTPGTTPGNQSIVTLASTFAVTPGANATVAISGVSSSIGVTRSTNVTLSVKDFTVTRNTANVATNVGTNITDTIVVKGLNGFTGPVALTCLIEGAPLGTSCTLSNPNPAASAAGTSVTATIISSAATTPQGTYIVDVTGTNSSQQKAVSFTVQIKDFTLGAGTNAITLPQPPPGQSSALHVPLTLTAQNGYNSSTILSCGGQPAGVTCAFAPASGVPTIGGLGSILTISGASTAAAGPHDITVKATAGTLIRTQVITVTLWGPNFTQAVTPTTQNVTNGSSAAYTVTYTPLGGMTDDITVGCGAPLPSGVTCTPVPATANPGNGYQSVVTLQTTFGTTPAANATVFIQGVSAAQNNLTRGNNVTLSVKDFTVTTNTPIVTTHVGSNITDTILVKGLNGFTGNIPLTCVIVEAPTGASCNLSNVNPAASSAGTSVAATINSSLGTTPTGSYTVQVTGTTSGGSKMAQFTLNINDFSMEVDTTYQNIVTTGNVGFHFLFTALGGFNSQVSLSCVTPLPTGLTCTFASTAFVPSPAGSPLLLTINVAATNPITTNNVTVRAVSGSLVHTVHLQIAHGNAPIITSMDPTHGDRGDTFTLRGTNFHFTITVDFNGVPAQLTGANDEFVSAIVPPTATTGPVRVTVNNLVSNAMTYTVDVQPFIHSLQPTSGVPGDTVEIYGARFGNAQGNGTVSFNGVPAAVSFWSNNEIDAVVPAGAGSGDVAVVTQEGRVSNGSFFTVLP